MSAERPQNPARRRFLKWGLAGAAVLGGVGIWRGISQAPPQLQVDGAFANPEVRALWAVMAGAVLQGTQAADHQDELLARIETAHQFMTPSNRAQLESAYALLTGELTRGVISGQWAAWSQASVEDAGACLQRWADSSLAASRTLYTLFHDLSLGTWYGMPQSWPDIGYPGPPF